MKKYFYSNNTDKQGPFSFEELKNENINEDTLIWFEGLEDWTPANDLKDMKSILEFIPPPIPGYFDKESHIVQTDEELQEKESIEIQSSQTVKIEQGTLSRAFSFDGRIGRTDYCVSNILFLTIALFVNAIADYGRAPIILLAFIPLFWYLLAQGAKRCHDMGESGWYQIFPFYPLWMIFAKGESGTNKYGIDPKN